jgi:hypothetical protein
MVKVRVTGLGMKHCRKDIIARISERICKRVIRLNRVDEEVTFFH